MKTGLAQWCLKLPIQRRLELMLQMSSNCRDEDGRSFTAIQNEVDDISEEAAAAEAMTKRLTQGHG
jgi:hypothetical protein